MKHLSLFSGIGGIDLAAKWAGFETICFVEIDPYCQKVLNKHWPNTPIIKDVKDVTRERLIQVIANAEHIRRYKAKEEGKDIRDKQEVSVRKKLRNNESKGIRGVRGYVTRNGIFVPKGSLPPITLITGGVPCQPASVAGKRRGTEDDRWLWPEAIRILSEIKPAWAVFENPTGILTLEDGVVFDNLLSQMEAEGYEVQPVIIPACAVNAPHRRDRCFIVGHAKELHQYGSNGKRVSSQTQVPEFGNTSSTEDVADTISIRNKGLHQSAKRNAKPVDAESTGSYVSNAPGRRFVQCKPQREQKGDISQGDRWWAVEPDVGRVAHGIPHRVDRLRCLGNAVVPQQIYPILKAIADYETNL